MREIFVVGTARNAIGIFGGVLKDVPNVIPKDEAFAVQACAAIKEPGFEPSRVNSNGAGISLGYPVGANGAITTTKAIAGLHHTGVRYALEMMCIGGGQGTADIFDRV